MGLIDLVAKTATREELISLLGAAEEQRQILGREVYRMRCLLVRYRDETPLGHQPHMITSEVDKILGRD